jgi:predicted phage-related endonuclease
LIGAQIDALVEKRDAIKATLREELEGTAEEVGPYKLKVISCSRTGFDAKGFTAEHPRLAKKFTKTSSYEQFKISKDKEK